MACSVFVYSLYSIEWNLYICIVYGPLIVIFFSLRDTEMNQSMIQRTSKCSEELPFVEYLAHSFPLEMLKRYEIIPTKKKQKNRNPRQ